MKTLIVLLVFITSFAEAKPPHWSHWKRTASGKHHYMKPGWPYERHCVGMYRRTPIKMKTVKLFKRYGNNHRNKRFLRK